MSSDLHATCDMVCFHGMLLQYIHLAWSTATIEVATQVLGIYLSHKILCEYCLHMLRVFVKETMSFAVRAT